MGYNNLLVIAPGVAFAVLDTTCCTQQDDEPLRNRFAGRVDAKRALEGGTGIRIPNRRLVAVVTGGIRPYAPRQSRRSFFATRKTVSLASSVPYSQLGVSL